MASRTFRLALVAGVLSATFTPELARAATEQPHYTVLHREGALELRRYLTEFGLGGRTGSGANNETAGLLPAPSQWTQLTGAASPVSVSVVAAWVLYSQRQALVQVPWLGSRRLK